MFKSNLSNVSDLVSCHLLSTTIKCPIVKKAFISIINQADQNDNLSIIIEQKYRSKITKLVASDSVTSVLIKNTEITCFVSQLAFTNVVVSVPSYKIIKLVSKDVSKKGVILSLMF